MEHPFANVVSDVKFVDVVTEQDTEDFVQVVVIHLHQGYLVRRRFHQSDYAISNSLIVMERRARRAMLHGNVTDVAGIGHMDVTMPARLE